MAAGPTHAQRSMPPARCSLRSIAMTDVLYILIGAAFLGGCVLYAIACERL
jgi:hypothetical protein